MSIQEVEEYLEKQIAHLQSQFIYCTPQNLSSLQTQYMTYVEVMNVVKGSR